MKVVGARFHFHCDRFQPGFLLDVSVGYVVGSPGHLCATDAEMLPQRGLNANIQPPTNTRERTLLARETDSLSKCLCSSMCVERTRDVSPRLTLTVEAESVGLEEQRRGSFTHMRVYLFSRV